MSLIYKDIEEMPVSKIIYGWEYFSTIGIVGYGVLWMVSKFI